MNRAWWRRRRVVAFASAALVLFVLFLVAPIIAKPIVRAKLQREVDPYVNARVEIGSLSWLPMWSVTLRDLRLVANDPTTNTPFDLLRTERVAIALTGAPFGSGPIVAKHIAIESPVLRLIETRDGVIGLIANPSPPQSEPDPRKPSQIFQLHDLQLTNAQVIYEDRATAGSLPMIWRDLTVQVRPADQQSQSNYACVLSTKDGRSGFVESTASLDLDAMTLNVDHCNASMNFANAASDANSSSLPGVLQLLLKDIAAKGDLTAAISGSIPLADPLAASLVATIEIRSATAMLPGCPKPLDDVTVKLICRTKSLSTANGSGSRLMIRSDFDHFVARTSGSSVQVLGGSIAVNGAGGWGADNLKIAVDPGKDQSGLPIEVQELIKRLQIVGKLTCTISGSGPFDVNERTMGDVDLTMTIAPEDVSVHPPGLPIAITDFGEIGVRIHDGIATIEKVRAGYGDDVFFLQAASLPLSELLHSRIKIDAMKGCITFARQQPEYPAAVQEVIENAKPRGPFWFEGGARVDMKDVEKSLDYDVRITTDRGAISTLRHHIPLMNVHTDVRVTPRLVAVNRFNADVLSGKVSTTGRLTLDDMSYNDIQINLRRIDLNSLAQMTVKPGERPITVTGELSCDANLSGKGIDAQTALANLKGSGAVQVERGEFFRVPGFADVARMVHLSDSATVGEAGCTFRIDEGKVHVVNAAIGAPAIGVRADGQIDLLNDFALDLNAVADPFSDWDRQVRRENNPAANLAGAVLGAVQKKMDSVTEEYLYRVHVGGTIADPKTELITAPSMQKK